MPSHYMPGVFLVFDKKTAIGDCGFLQECALIW